MTNPPSGRHIEIVMDDRAHILLLSRLVLDPYRADVSAGGGDGEGNGASFGLDTLSEEGFERLVGISSQHHVLVRGLERLKEIAARNHQTRLLDWSERALEAEHQRSRLALEWLHVIVDTLENSGCPTTVIKSLDHWPDLGSDLDLYTSGEANEVLQVMRDKLRARMVRRSWGDRLAGKWNFEIPGLAELVEIHVRYLGQTGEQTLMAERVLARSQMVSFNGHRLRVPAPEERILISTLQRMYRHFYFRLCDLVDNTGLLAGELVDFEELKRGAELGGIWPGVRSFVLIVNNYAEKFGVHLRLAPAFTADRGEPLELELKGDFLRVPITAAAGLYGSQLVSAGRNRDLRAVSRLGLLPPLAVSALVAYRLTGSDKGVW